QIETNSPTHAMHAPRELKGRIETNSLTHAMHAPRELKGRIETNSLTHAMHAPRELKGRSAKAGGLVVVGSYVPGSSAQLENLLALPGVIGVELPVERVIHDATEARDASREAGRQLEAAVETGRVGVLYTSRKLVTSTDQAENLEIGKKVSQALIAAFHEVVSRPRFIIAKGGITSH